MRIACVMIQNFAVQLALLADPSLNGPIVVGGLPFEAKPVYDVSAEAMAYGIKPGMLLSQAYALCPKARFLAAREEKYQELFQRVINILDKFSPVVDVVELGHAYLDVTGVKNESELGHEIITSIAMDTGLKARLGISSGKFFSWIAAFISRAELPSIVPHGKEDWFVAPISVDLLPCASEIKERLHLLGIHSVGQLKQFSCGVLAAQFGREGILLYELSHGIDRCPLIPRQKPEVVIEVAEVYPPAVDYIHILYCCEIRLKKMLSDIEAQGKSCREVGLKVRLASGNLVEKRFPLKEATNSTALILHRLRTWLEGVRFSAPVTEAELSLWLTKDQGKQLHLWLQGQRVRQELTKVATELKLRLGYQPLKKWEPVTPTPLLPERRFRLTDVGG